MANFVPEAPSNWRVLLVDDEPTQRLITARLLKRAGFAVDTAQNGKEALEQIVTGSYQLLVTDWEMPEMDGVALCRAVRSAKIDGYVYTILLTSRDAIEHLVMGLQAGADDYLIKPVLEPELLARLNTGKRIVTLERSLRAVVEENRRLSVTDPLTGAQNRRYLMEQLPSEIDRSARYDHRLAVLMCDVDHFKRVNDTYGHQAGDEVLKRVVTLIKSKIRTTDWISRYGGEEFVIVLPETNFTNAAKVAESLRAAIASQAIDYAGHKLTVTASFGVSGWDRAVPAEAPVDVLIERCDEGVYASKDAGRNRVTAKTMDLDSPG
ncbi:MAG: diguanylate cyclase [Candidatus Obscuribacterales bacterium]|nr:diguanylate cyclase [Steroidobacteraceae bacterium]